MIKRIIFDIDGTLITGVDFSSYVANTLKKYGIEDVEKTITYVKDRPGHDKRYAIDCTKIKTKLGWERKMTF